MQYILVALTVYKIVQVLDALTPKEAMPWVKIIFSLLVSLVITVSLRMPDPFIAGCAVAALAGIVHSLIRLIVLVGDMAQRKSMR